MAGKESSDKEITSPLDTTRTKTKRKAHDLWKKRQDVCFARHSGVDRDTIPPQNYELQSPEIPNP